MKWYAVLASLCFTMGLAACQADSKSDSRPDPKPSPTPDPAKQPAAVPPGTGGTPPKPSGEEGALPEVPPGATGGLGGAACSETEMAVPKGAAEDAARKCCDQVHHSKSCLDKTHTCWSKKVFPGIEKALANGTCPK